MKRFLLSFFMGLWLLVSAHAQQTKTQLNTEISTNFPDNTAGLITPQLLRTTTSDFVASWQQFPSVNTQTGTSYTVQLSDYGKLITTNNAGAVTVTVPQATGSFGTFNFYLTNLGAGSATLTPTTSTICGSATKAVAQNSSIFVVSDGTNYQCFGPFGAGGTGTVTSVGLTMPGVFTVSSSPVTTSGTIAVTANGTSGGIPYFSSASTLASSGLLTANSPVIGGGAGVAPTVGTRSGNTTAFQTTSGALTNGNCVKADASSNLVDQGGVCATLAGVEELTNKTLTSSVGKGTWTASGTWTLPAVTLGGTVSGGGNQLNNIIIGTSTPLAGTFTALTGTSGSHTGLTGLGIRDTSAAFDVTLAATSTSATLTAGRILTYDMGNVAHTIAYGTTAGTITFPNAAAVSVAALNINDQTLAGGANVTSLSLSAGNITVDCGARPLQYITGSTSAWVITAPANDGSCIIFVTNPGSSVNTPTFSGFTAPATPGDPIPTGTTAKYAIHVWRINSVSSYRVAAYQ